MYTSIRVNEFDLLSFFESNPSFIGEEAAGECRYIYVRDNFKISIFISIYEMCVSVYIGYNNNVLYREKIDNIVEIIKIDEATLRIVGLLENIVLNKFPQISAIIENKETNHNSDTKNSRISILFDEFDFFEFFESDPTVIGIEKDGRLQYFYQTEDFKVIFDLSIYEHKVNISISHNNDIVYSEQFNSVEEIRKVDADTLRMITEDKWIIVRKWSQISVQVEDRLE